ncbi:MAG: hypothetical protein ACM3L6_01760 [Deltaproteobacteria bacterium]
MERGRQLVFIVAVAAAAVVLYACVRSCSQTEETRVQRALYGAVAGVEQNDASRYGRFVSLFYADEEGRNKLALLAAARQLFDEFRPLRVEIKQLKITVADDRKTAAAVIGFKCYFKHLPDGKLYYEAGRFEADLTKEERQWRVRRLRYIDADEIMFIQAVA